MTLAQWADLATVAASIVAIVSLAIIAWQASAIKDQVQVSLAHLSEFTERERASLSYQMLIIYGEPKFSQYVYEAWKLLKNPNVPTEELLRRLREEPPITKPEEFLGDFMFNFRILSTYMEQLSIAYFNNHVDKNIIWKQMYGPVIYSFRATERLITELRREMGEEGVLIEWQNLAREFERRGAPT